MLQANMTDILMKEGNLDRKPHEGGHRKSHSERMAIYKLGRDTWTLLAPSKGGWSAHT